MSSASASSGSSEGGSASGSGSDTSESSSDDGFSTSVIKAPPQPGRQRATQAAKKEGDDLAAQGDTRSEGPGGTVPNAGNETKSGSGSSGSGSSGSGSSGSDDEAENKHDTSHSSDTSTGSDHSSGSDGESSSGSESSTASDTTSSSNSASSETDSSYTASSSGSSSGSGSSSSFSGSTSGSYSSYSSSTGMSFSSDDSELEAAAAAKARVEAQKEAPPPAPVEMSPEDKEKVALLESEMKIAEAELETLLSTQEAALAAAEDALQKAEEDLEAPEDQWTHELTGKLIGDPKDKKLKAAFDATRKKKVLKIQRAKKALVDLEKEQESKLKAADQKLEAKLAEAEEFAKVEFDRNGVLLSATPEGVRLHKSRMKAASRIGRNLDSARGKDIDTRYEIMVHRAKKEIQKTKVKAGYAKSHSKTVLSMEERRIKAAKRRKKKLLRAKKRARRDKLKLEEQHRLYMLERGERARRLLNADTQKRAKLLEREKPWCQRKHQKNRIGLVLSTSLAMFCSFIAMCMSLAIIDFRFPAEAMHKCGNSAPEVWTTSCEQIQLLNEFPYQCCQANVPLPQANIDLRIKYFGYHSATAVQSCGAAVGENYEVFSQDSYNATQVAHCASVTSANECGNTKVNVDDDQSAMCTWYFGYRPGPCDKEAQHEACESLEGEVECLRHAACRPNRDPWYMEAIIANHPQSTKSGLVPLEYIGKCLHKHNRSVARTACGMSQTDYCGDGTGPGTSYFSEIAWQSRRMTLAVGVMCMLSPSLLFLRGIRQLEFEKFRLVCADAKNAYIAVIALYGGNEDLEFNFSHVGSSTNMEEEEKLIKEKEFLEIHENKLKKKKKRHDKVVNDIKEKKRAEKRAKKAKRKAEKAKKAKAKHDRKAAKKKKQDEKRRKKMQLRIQKEKEKAKLARLEAHKKRMAKKGIVVELPTISSATPETDAVPKDTGTIDSSVPVVDNPADTFETGDGVSEVSVSQPNPQALSGEDAEAKTEGIVSLSASAPMSKTALNGNSNFSFTPAEENPTTPAISSEAAQEGNVSGTANESDVEDNNPSESSASESSSSESSSDDDDGGTEVSM
eukprot:g4357.t1